MADLIITIGANADKFAAEINKIKKQTQSIEAALGKVAKISGAAFLGFSVAIGGAVAQAAKFETIQTSFEVLTGSAEAAAKSIKQLSDFSAKTPFQFEEIANAGKKLLAFGVKVGDLPKKMQQIGDVAAAVGTPLGDLSLIIGQVGAAGKLTGERLNQLQEKAVPIGPALAKTLGVAETEVRALVSAGKVTTEVFNEAFALLSKEGGPAFGGMAKQSATLAGKISTLTDNVSLIAAEIGKIFLPAVKAVTEAFVDLFGFIRENPALIKLAAVVLGVGAVMTGLITALAVGGIAFLKFRAIVLATNLQLLGTQGGLLTLIKGLGGKLITALKTAAIGFKAVAFSVKGLIGATGIGLLVIIIADLALNWSTRLRQIQAIWVAFTKNISALALGLAEILSGVFTFNPFKVKSGLDKTIAVLKKGFKDFKKDVAEAIVAEDEFTDKTKKNAVKRAEVITKTLTFEEKLSAARELSNDEVLQAEQEFNAEREKGAKASIDKLITLEDKLKKAREARIKSLSSGPEGVVSAGETIAGGGELSQDEAIATGLGAVNTALQGAAGATKLISAGISTVANSFIPGIGGAVGQIFELFAQGPDAVRNMVQGFIDAIPLIIKNVLLAIPALGNALQTAGLEIIQGIFQTLPEIIIGLIQGALDGFLDLITMIPEIILDIVTSIPELLQEILSGLDEALTQFIEKVPEALQGLVAAVPKIVKALVKDIPKAVQAFINKIPVLVSKLASEIPAIVNKFSADLTKQIPSLIRTAIEGFIEQIPTIIKEFVKQIGEQFKQITNIFGGDGFLGFKEGGVGAKTFAHGGVPSGEGLGFFNPKELIVPVQNFDEVIDAVSRQRAGGVTPEAGGAGPQVVNNFDFSNSNLVDNQTFIDEMMARISESVQFSNGDLGAETA